MAYLSRRVFYRALFHPDERSLFSTALNLFLASMVILNILELVIMSVPEYGDRYLGLAQISLNFFVVIFSTEYLLRVWASADDTLSGATEHKRRLGYVFSPMGLVDLLSFLPILILWLVPSDMVGDLRILKLIAIVRILKLTRYSDALSMLARLYYDNRNTLLAAALVMLILSFIAATGIYYCERYVQPEAFGSIPKSMWWALVTLTTVGYGDMVPVTLGGKLFGVMVMISGVGIAAMPAGIFASSFMQLLREQERQRRRMMRKKKGRRIEDQHEGESSVAREQHLHFSRSEQREVDYLIEEFGVSFEQAVGIVMHYRH